MLVPPLKLFRCKFPISLDLLSGSLKAVYSNLEGLQNSVDISWAEIFFLVGAVTKREKMLKTRSARLYINDRRYIDRSGANNRCLSLYTVGRLLACGAGLVLEKRRHPFYGNNVEFSGRNVD